MQTSYISPAIQLMFYSMVRRAGHTHHGTLQSLVASYAGNSKELPEGFIADASAFFLADQVENEYLALEADGSWVKGSNFDEKLLHLEKIALIHGLSFKTQLAILKRFEQYEGTEIPFTEMVRMLEVRDSPNDLRAFIREAEGQGFIEESVPNYYITEEPATSRLREYMGLVEFIVTDRQATRIESLYAAGAYAAKEKSVLKVSGEAYQVSKFQAITPAMDVKEYPLSLVLERVPELMNSQLFQMSTEASLVVSGKQRISRDSDEKIVYVDKQPKDLPALWLNAVITTVATLDYRLLTWVEKLDADNPLHWLPIVATALLSRALTVIEAIDIPVTQKVITAKVTTEVWELHTTVLPARAAAGASYVVLPGPLDESDDSDEMEPVQRALHEDPDPFATDHDEEFLDDFQQAEDEGFFGKTLADEGYTFEDFGDMGSLDDFDTLWGLKFGDEDA